MKRLILIISLLIGTLSVMAQTAGSSLGNATSYVPVKGGLKVDSGLYLSKHFPVSYRSLDSTGILWYDLITKHLWYHNGTARKETVPKTYVDSAVASVSAGGVSIGSPIGGGTANNLLYVDGSSNLGQSGDIIVVPSSPDFIEFINSGNLVGLASPGRFVTTDFSGLTGVEMKTTTDGATSGIIYTQPSSASLSVLTPTVTGTKTQKYQNDTGFIALLKNLPTMSSFTASGVAGVFTYTTTVASGFTLSIVQSKNANATVDYSSVSGTTLSVHADSVTAGSSNLSFSYFLK